MCAAAAEAKEDSGNIGQEAWWKEGRTGSAAPEKKRSAEEPAAGESGQSRICE